VVSNWRSGNGWQDPAPDSGPWRALHRPGLSFTVTTVGRHGSSGPPAAHDAYRFTGEHPPAAAKTVRAATQQNSLLLSKEERWVCHAVRADAVNVTSAAPVLRTALGLNNGFTVTCPVKVSPGPVVAGRDSSGEISMG
jgi:hypothetical protein